MRRLILFVEGEGEADAVPTLVRRLLTEQGDWYDVLLDDSPFRVGSVDKLVKAHFHDWKRFLRASLKRPNVGGVLLILDGDIGKVAGKDFCAAAVAKSLAWFNYGSQQSLRSPFTGTPASAFCPDSQTTILMNS